MHCSRARSFLALGFVVAASVAGDAIAQPSPGPKKDTVAPKIDLMAPYKPSCPGSYSSRPPGSNMVLTTPGPFTLTTDVSGSQDLCVGKRAPTCAEGTLAVDGNGLDDVCKTATSSKAPQCAAQGYSRKAKAGADECEGGGAFVCPADHKAEHRAGADLCLPVGSCAAGSALAPDRSGSRDQCLTASTYSCPSGFHVLVDPRDNSNTHIPPALRPQLASDVCERNAQSARTGVHCGGGKIQYVRGGTDFCYAPTAPTTDPTCATGLKLFREPGLDVCAPPAYGVGASP